MEVDKRDAINGLVNGGLVAVGFGHGVDGQVRIVSDDSGVLKGVGARDRRWETVLLDVGTDHFFLVDSVDRLLAHAEEKRGHDDEVEVGCGVDANKEAQVVFVGVALVRD